MIIGIDMGATATKIVAMEADKLVFSKSFLARGETICEIIENTIIKSILHQSKAELLALTGVGSENCSFENLAQKVIRIPEIEATGEGGTWLSGVKEAVVVSIGTGTSLVLSKDGSYRHIGGSGVGSGTLRGLSKKLFGSDSLVELFKLAEKGSRYTVDITIGDLFSGTDTLPKDLTASNLAKASDEASKADWAKAIVNTVLEVAGSHGALACEGFGLKTVILTGGVTVTPLAKEIYDNFQRLYKLNYIIPPDSDYATAIGAVRIAAKKL